MFQIRSAHVWMTIGLLAAVLVANPVAAGDKSPTLARLVQLPAQLTLCGEVVPERRSDVRERFEKEMLLSLWDRPQVILWLKRANRYMPFIEKALREKQLPVDLKYLAVVESALRAHAGSAKGAIGFWQLLPETARRYGLVVDDRVDQRRNLYLSTPAALDYLKDLHDQLGSWTLALAAYNMGEEGLRAEILAQNARDYYRLYLPIETQRFIFRLLSVKLILSNPERYGFSLSAQQLYPPIQTMVKVVDLFEEIPLPLVARAAGTDFKTIKDLNPEIRGHYLAAGQHRLRLPKDTPKGFAQRLENLRVEHRQLRQQRIYIVQAGDNLSAIADKFGVPLAALIIWNRIDLNRSIHPGQRLVIYPGTLDDIPSK